MLRMLLLCLWLLGAAHAASEPFLLPGSAAPAHYDVRLLFDVDPVTNFSFYGVVDILLTAKKSTSELVLHAQDYNIVSEAVTLQGDRAPKVLDTRLNNTYNFLTVKLNDKLTPGQNYSLKIPFHGNLKPALEGVYISSYTDASTKTKQFLVTTQFEATHARRGFPCFDEPIHKATFTITIGHRRDYTAISNMPLRTSSRENALADSWDWKKIETTFKKPQSEFVFDEFEKSVPMSTYLVAFVVSNFLYKDSPSGLSNTKFRIWARKDAIDQTTYASEIGPKVLSYFEKFFNVSFPLPKQDMIALPDFSAGAMENWGLITYRETALLYDKEQSSSMNKERVVEVIAHELAHQWFGNLVTMKWWSDLWLNEGFATFAASLGMSAVAPEWRSDDNNAVDHIMSVFALDSLESSHPVVVPIDDPKRISEIFDEISYRKGSTLIRMMVKFLGEDVFRKALNSYLVKHSYSNAQQDDLWAEFTKASEMYSGGLSRNVTVKRIMDTWTTQTGYPVVTVKRDYDDKTLTVMQKRFMHLGSRSSTALSWWVPLRVLCASEADGREQPVEWLADDEGVKNEHKFEHGAEANEWVLFNPDMIAPYRINYDARNWELLIKTLNSDRYTAVPKLGRVQLLLDAFAFAWNNQIDYSVAFNLAAYLDRETEYLPLNTGMSQLQRLHLVLRRTSDYGIFLKYIRRLIQPRYEQAGGLTKKMIVNGDDLNSVKMQVLTSMWACRAKITNCEDNAIEMFKEWMQMSDPDANNPIPLDLRRTVYCVAISRGSVAEFRFALARMQRANVAAARATLQHALSCTNVVWILKQYLEWTITEGSQEVRPQDAARVIADITSSTVGYYVAKDFIYTRIKDIHETGQGKRLGAVLKTLLGQFTTQLELDEFLKWKEENAKYLADFKLSVSQAVETSRVNIQWLEKNRKIIVDRIRAQTP